MPLHPMHRPAGAARPAARPPRRRQVALAIAALVLGAATALALAWHYSDLILLPGDPPSLHERRILAADSGRVRLARDTAALRPGVWALEWQGGFGRVGAVLASRGDGVTRAFRAEAGVPPVRGWARMCGVSRSADPLSMLGLSYDRVAFDGPLGQYPAWFVPGRDSTWVVYVHGRATSRAEGLRTLGVLSARGLPGLLATYRNDAGAPASADGLNRLGLTEWEDLEAAVRYALGHGARDVALSGYSMGGQVVLQFMARSPLASRVRCVLLESPVLDWKVTLEGRARVMGVPQVGTALGRWAASVRAGIDWDQLDRVAHVERAGVPILLFHGVHDTFAPEWVSERFARRLPARVTLVRVQTGNHVEAWNADPTRYAAVLNAWCDARGLGRSTP
jgi:uncharacterized protein